ncbi:hypothetical protein [Williamsia sp.]|uniref:hypothetical protein n=1 Tax=Williamsia sp. TaxID=1872085 RepID=UPI001A1A6D78|nr:hypothetical protein [Williamsia sp.]MBJ7288245.1 hypothetical protein [Williamsia sp.]
MGVAACGAEDAKSSPTPASTVTVTQSDVPTSVDNSAATEAATSADAGSTEAAEASAPATGGAPIMRFPGDANVNAADFFGPGAGINGYFFQSPSGNVRCGIHFDNPQLPSGCQALVSVRSSDGVSCRNGGNSVYSTQLISGAAVSKCVNQPVFVGGSGNPGQGTVGGRVLQYGQIISSGGATCESAAVGISCWASSVGFTLARDRNDTYAPGYGQTR